LASSSPSPRRDPWAWATVLAVLPLLARSLFPALGEPAAEDFDMLRHAAAGGASLASWLDGGGTSAFWRPVAFQGYFALLGPLVLRHPFAVALLHVALLAVACLLLFRTLRTSFPGPVAFAAASFPLLAESTRVLVTWPSQFGDLGALLFSALALHEASRRRLPTALVALALALLCKEVAIVTALLLPFVPGLVGGDDRSQPAGGGAERPQGAAAERAQRAGGGGGERARWLAGCGAVLVTWALAYAWVRAHAGLELPHGLESDPGRVATPLPARLAWAWSNSVRALHSLPARAAPADAVRLGVALAPALLAALAAVFVRSVRARLAARRGWVLWGCAWFALAAATLAPVHPFWAPVRSQFAGVGWGIATAALLAAAHPLLLAATVVVRLALLLASPGPATWITPEIVDRGSSVDFERISRIQLLMRESRFRLQRRFRTLPHGATVGFRDLPLSTEYAFGEGNAVRAWYADTTLHWASAAHDSSALTWLDYQPEQAPQVVLLDPEALRWQRRGVALLEAGRWAEAIAALERADSAQVERDAVVFLGDGAGRKAQCLAQLRRFPEAEAFARRALAASGRDTGARLALAVALAVRKERAQALAQLDTLRALDPHDEEAAALARALRGP
jgi:hypothetical protein